LQPDPDYQLQIKVEEVNGSVKFNSGFAVDMIQALEYILNFT
jgi:hypothetical protein